VSIKSLNDKLMKDLRKLLDRHYELKKMIDRANINYKIMNTNPTDLLKQTKNMLDKERGN
jgi:hypothetical protein